MFELIIAGGWVMLPIILCSVIALAIIVERFWSLRRSRVVPKQLFSQVWHLARNNQLDAVRINTLRAGSELGQVLAAGLVNLDKSREVMKESIEEAGRHVVHKLESYLNFLGTIAAISPLLGLLGTVVGLIKVFDAITTHGVGNPGVLAGGISEALLTTVAGLMVAIPALMFYRFFRRRVDELVILMEQEAVKLVEVMHGERDKDSMEELK